MIFLLFAFLGEIATANIVECAEKKGFFYRNVSVEKAESCEESSFCIEKNGDLYLIKQKDSTIVDIVEKKRKIEISLEPDSKYVAYYLYVRRGLKIKRSRMKKKNLTLLHNGEINTIQISGVGLNGPEVIYQKTIKKPSSLPFYGDIMNSLAYLRKKAGIPPLKKDKSLAKAAQHARVRMKNKGPVHITSKKGNIRHSGLNRKVLGENLFVAASEKRAWHLLQNSPSHLYNMLNPVFRNVFISTEERSGMKYGVMLFSD